jgi:ubiquitin-conjugating enzyme E2 O
MTNDGYTRYNPNLYKCGKVCVSILNTWSGDKWSSCQTINSILLTLCSLLNDAPLENEPGHNKSSRDFIPYQKSIEFKNIDFAICEMILKQKIPEPFQMFYPFIKEHFINNYDKLLTFIQSHKIDQPSTQIVSIYNMNTHIDYSSLEKKLIKTKQFLDSQK